MSASLVQRSLRLLKEEDIPAKGKKSRKFKRAHRDKQKHIQIADNKIRLTLTEAQKAVASIQRVSEDNLQKLQLLSSRNIDGETAHKIFERAVKNRTVKEPEIKGPESTVFTEEDFLKFEQEYFCS